MKNAEQDESEEREGPTRHLPIPNRRIGRVGRGGRPLNVECRMQSWGPFITNKPESPRAVTAEYSEYAEKNRRR